MTTAFQDAVDAAVTQALAARRCRDEALLDIAAGIDPHDAGRVAVFLRSTLPLTLGGHHRPLDERLAELATQAPGAPKQ